MKCGGLILKIESQIKSDPFNPFHHIALAKAYLEEGDEERARKVVAAKRMLPLQDPAVHLEWGKLCQELGMARQAMESYEKAIALDPNNSESHFRVAILYHEKGMWERALKHLQKTVALSSQNLEAQKMLASLYDQIGFTGSVKAVQRAEKKIFLPMQVSSVDFSDEDISIILNLFQGKEFGYVRYYLEATGNITYSHVHGVMGNKEIRSHLMGEETYGFYPLRGNRTLKFACIQIGLPWRKIVENLKNTGFLTLLEDKVQQYAGEVWRKSREYGIPAYLENSGERSRRVWFFLEEFLPFELVERFLHALLDKIRAPFPEITLSFLLGMKGKGIGYEDHPVMLPLGFNPRSATRCFFTDDYGEPYEDQLLWMKKIRPVSRKEIQEFIRITGKRRTVWTLEEAPDSLQRLQKKCSVIEEIIRKAQSGRMLNHEEKLVLFFTLGFLQDDYRSLHSVLEPCPDYRPKKVDRLALRLKGNPISCPKIRELLPATTAYLPCNCSLIIPHGGYPTPLLHVNPGWIPTRTSEELATSHRQLEDRYKYICQKILELRKEKEELEAMLKNQTMNDKH